MQNLQKLLQEKGIKQKWVAQKMGISTNKLYRIMKGKQEMTVSEKYFLSDLLGIDENEI